MRLFAVICGNTGSKRLGGLDILVNNAGRQQFCESIENSPQDFDATFKTNVYAMFWITKQPYPIFHQTA